MFQCTISILILVKVETLVHKLPHLMLLKILHYANHILVSCSFVLVCGPDSFIRLICYFVCANDGLSLVIQLRSRLIAKMIWPFMVYKSGLSLLISLLSISATYAVIRFDADLWIDFRPVSYHLLKWFVFQVRILLEHPRISVLVKLLVDCFSRFSLV